MKFALIGFCDIKPHCQLSSCIPLILKEKQKKEDITSSAIKNPCSKSLKHH